MAKRNSTPEPRSAQEKSSYFRHLKVREGYYPHHFDARQPYSVPVPDPVPWVQIKGYWLNQAGFTIGTQLSVEVQTGCIILKTKTPTNKP